VLITTGSQQGLDLVAKVLVDPGSRVLVETPTYLGALQAFAPMEPVSAWTSDDEGVVPQALAGRAADARASLYVLPNFQNPTGRTMSEARRAALVARRASWACRWSRTTPMATCGSTRRRPPAGRALARRLHLPGLVFQGAGARPAPGLPGGAAGAVPQAAAGQAGGRPAHPGFNQRMVPR
jgi:2-aminoadipate transaminase